MLREIYFDLAKKYTDDLPLTEKLWIEVESKYSEKARHYHNLSHLEHLLSQLNEIKKHIIDWDSVLFAVFYHDIIYKPTKSNNEEKSTALAEQILKQIDYPPEKISTCAEMIMATKKHMLTGNSDTDHFTDADLSILGQSWEVYRNYCKQIRKEFAIYPDLVYNPGRKKVLHHFLNMDRIYKTDHFYKKFEDQAKKNLSEELALL